MPIAGRRLTASSVAARLPPVEVLAGEGAVDTEGCARSFGGGDNRQLHIAEHVSGSEYAGTEVASYCPHRMRPCRSMLHPNCTIKVDCDRDGVSKKRASRLRRSPFRKTTSLSRRSTIERRSMRPLITAICLRCNCWMAAPESRLGPSVQRMTSLVHAVSARVISKPRVPLP